MSNVYFAGRAKACPAARAETGRAGPGPDATRLLASRHQNLKETPLGHQTGVKTPEWKHPQQCRPEWEHPPATRITAEWRPLGPNKFPTQGAFGAIKLLFHRRGTLRNSEKRGVTRFLALTELPGL